MLSIEIPKKDKESLDLFTNSEIEDITVVESKKFDGTTEILTILIPVALKSVHVIGKVLIQLIKSKNAVTIKANGLELNNINQNNVIDILNTIRNDK